MVTIRFVYSSLDAIRSGLQHLGIHAQFAPVFHGDSMLGGIGVQYRRDVVLGVHRGEQHAGDSEDMIAACVA